MLLLKYNNRINMVIVLQITGLFPFGESNVLCAGHGTLIYGIIDGTIATFDKLVINNIIIRFLLKGNSEITR